MTLDDQLKVYPNKTTSYEQEETKTTKNKNQFHQHNTVVWNERDHNTLFNNFLCHPVIGLKVLFYKTLERLFKHVYHYSIVDFLFKSLVSFWQKPMKRWVTDLAAHGVVINGWLRPFSRENQVHCVLLSSYNSTIFIVVCLSP